MPEDGDRRQNSLDLFALELGQVLSRLGVAGNGDPHRGEQRLACRVRSWPQDAIDINVLRQNP